MSYDIASAFPASLRRKRGLVAFVAVVLAAWLFEFATHVHGPENADLSPHQLQHVCTFCATLAAGVGFASAVVHPPLAPVVLARSRFASIPPSVVRTAAYRSRAPPSIALA